MGKDKARSSAASRKGNIVINKPPERGFVIIKEMKECKNPHMNF